MPFKSQSQRRACYAKNDPDWNCETWEKHTPKNKKLPESVKKAELAISECFSKIAKEMFDPRKSRPVPGAVIESEIIQQAKQDKTRGMSPVEYRNELTRRRKGIVQRNRESAKSS